MLPRRFDNTYGGHRAALWLFAGVLLMKTGIALGTIFNGREAAQTADGIPLDSFGAAGAAAVVSMFAVWGLAQFVISTIGVLALVRYRAMVPLMFALLLFEHVARRLLFLALPIPRNGAAPGLAINLALIGVMVVGLALSLARPS
jgi:cytochrome bd-type quinol oxidase subunit 2